MDEVVDISRIWPQVTLMLSAITAAGVGRSLSGLLLRRFERGVVAAMGESSESSERPPPAIGPTAPPRMMIEPDADAPGNELLGRIAAARLCYAGASLTAAACGVAVAVIGWMRFVEPPNNLRDWIVWTHPYWFLLIPCALTPFAGGSRRVVAGGVCLLGFGGLMIWLKGFPTAAEILSLTVVVPAAVVALVLSRRTLAASTLLFFPAFLILTMGYGHGIPRGVTSAVDVLGAPRERFAQWDATLAAAALTVASGAVLVVVAHARKWTSGRMMRLDFWWLVAAVMITFVLTSASGVGPDSFAGYAAAGAVAVLGWLIAERAAMAFVRRRTLRHPNRKLLLLRVFGHAKRSEDLLRGLRDAWLYAGSIQLIAGADLARATLDIDELWEVLRHGVARRFVASEADLRRRMASLDLEPDPDGRYRVNEFFGRNDTWKPTVQALAKHTDVVLLDVRGLTPANRGVAWEVGQLAEFVPFERLVLLMDETTDRRTLEDMMARAAATCTEASPNYDRATTVRGLVASGRASRDRRRLVALLAADPPI